LEQDNSTVPRERRGLTRGEVIGTIAILALVFGFGKACLWQVRRLHERRAKNASIAARLAQPPIPFATIMHDTTGALYRRIEIRGTYDDDHAIILPGRALNGTPGVHILTPVIQQGSDTAILVNRGWLPSPDAATVDMSLVPHASDSVVIGLALAFPARNASVSNVGDSIPRAGEFKRVWYTIDERALRAQFPYPLAPFVVQILATPSTRGLPRPLDPPPMDEGPHLSYAIQWFSFAVIAIVGWITFLVRRRTERRTGRVVRAPPHPPAI
jgi:surfeit locus 1 family protein